MTRNLAIFLPSFGNGGVERMMVNLAIGFTAYEIPTDFVIRNSDVPYINSLPSGVRLVELDSLDRNTLLAASQYLAENKPAALLTSKDENDEIAVHAKIQAGVNTRIVLRAPVNVTSRLKHKHSGPVKKWTTYRRMRRVYNLADSFVAVSQGVAEDIVRITRLPRSSIHVIRNPVITPGLEEMASSPLDHPWFNKKECPIVLGIGRLGRQKNFEFLIEAYCIVRKKFECKLMILGEGRRHTRLMELVRKLGLDGCVDLPGFVDNPYAYLAKSDLFALSSMWEGSPNALVEALGLGVPVVATDCESGPREILQSGRVGRLVSIGDVQNFADAILNTLINPPKPELLRMAVDDYTIERAARGYLDVLINNSSCRRKYKP